MEFYYYVVHVSKSTDVGFFILVEIEMDVIPCDIDIIDYCIKTGKLSPEDSKQVDSITEITVMEYNEMRS